MANQKGTSGEVPFCVPLRKAVRAALDKIAATDVARKDGNSEKQDTIEEAVVKTAQASFLFGLLFV